MTKLGDATSRGGLWLLADLADSRRTINNAEQT